MSESLLHAAADEQERQRGLLVEATVSYNTQIIRGNRLAAQVASLRAVIENAPHEETCAFFPETNLTHGRPCTCWKADVL